MRPVPGAAPGLLLAVLLPGLAAAGDCRGLVQPLLLQAEPAALSVDAARQVCEHEARGNDPEATYGLALFSLGLAGVWRPEAAIPLMRMAAGQGVSEAQYWLAWQTESGPALANDPEAALYWYEQAARNRHRLALARLATAYERGELGMTPDARRALDLRAQIRRCDEELAAAR